MKITSIFAMALPAVTLAQQSSSVSSTTSDAPAPTGPPDLTQCEEIAGGYADACARCNPNCIDSSAYEQCLTSVFTFVNYYQAQCEARGGYSCKEKAIAEVCD